MNAILQYSLVTIAFVLVEVAVLARIVLRPNRDPTSRLAWLFIVGVLPLLGIIAYLFFGEVSIGRRRVARRRAVIARLQALQANGSTAIPFGPHAGLFRLGQSISGFLPVGGNSGRLLADSNAAIDSIVADIEAAREHVHLLFYIWLPDNNGCKVIEALKRAAARGIKCRAMADDLGSRTLIRSQHWQAMRRAGVQVATGLPIGNLLLRPFMGRIDLRNHRKIVVIDGGITYCGSQNCADPEFLVKARYAPWVDAMVRFEGPIARQNQLLFASDWMSRVDENLEDLFRGPCVATSSDAMPAQVIATGPTGRFSAMPEMFEALMFSAQRELIISTPYYVPTESLQSALCTTARRGVATRIIFPARNDSRVVAAASRSYYADLLAAGVEIHEYVGGLLHTKSLTVDGQITLIGSANMDRRSFDLNFENNILLYDLDLTAAMRQRQLEYIAHSTPVTLDMVASWSLPRRLWNNSIATMGPLL
jgi:cardiolipin synthase A/B